VSLSGDDVDDLRGYWARLSEGGTVSVPLEKQMWGDEFGMCADRFGVGWLVVLVGAALVAGADTRAEADTAAAASVLVGVGFVVVALGHALLAVGLKAPVSDGSLATAPYPGPDPYAGTPLARRPADRPAVGHPSG